MDDVIAVLERGHELGCHTFAHCDSWKTDSGVYEQSIIQNRAALDDLIPSASFRSFAYPISEPRPAIKRNAAKHFVCCRGGGQKLNVGTADLNQLSAYFLEKSRDDIQAVKTFVDLNCKVNGWVIFATHDVSEHPSPYGCTPTFFDNVVAYAAQSGAEILPVMNAIEKLRASSVDVPSRGGLRGSQCSGTRADRH
jgi:peptidoglycan/xylan/chitin deacetylase (PgdA/CDA1 family)